MPSTIQTHPVVVVGIFTVVVLRTTVYVVSVVLEAEGRPTGAVDGPVVVVTMPVTIDSCVGMTVGVVVGSVAVLLVVVV